MYITLWMVENGALIVANTILFAHLYLSRNCTDARPRLVLCYSGPYKGVRKIVNLESKWEDASNCMFSAGISGKTQFLLFLVHLIRFVEVLRYASGSILLMLSGVANLIFLLGTVLSVYYFYVDSYQKQYDTFRIELIILPCLVFAILSVQTFESAKVPSTFSVYLHALAIIPQTQFLVNCKPKVEKIVTTYVSAMVVYTTIQLVNAIFYFLYAKEEVNSHVRLILAAQIIQSMFYFDFFDCVIFQSSNAKVAKVAAAAERNKYGNVTVAIDEKNGQNEKNFSAVTTNDVCTA